MTFLSSLVGAVIPFVQEKIYRHILELPCRRGHSRSPHGSAAPVLTACSCGCCKMLPLFTLALKESDGGALNSFCFSPLVVGINLGLFHWAF